MNKIKEEPKNRTKTASKTYPIHFSVVSFLIIDHRFVIFSALEGTERKADGYGKIARKLETLLLKRELENRVTRFLYKEPSSRPTIMDKIC